MKRQNFPNKDLTTKNELNCVLHIFCTCLTSSRVLSSSYMLFISSSLWCSCITWFSNAWFCWIIVASCSSNSVILLWSLLACVLLSLSCAISCEICSKLSSFSFSSSLVTRGVSVLIGVEFLTHCAYKIKLIFPSNQFHEITSNVCILGSGGLVGIVSSYCSTWRRTIVGGVLLYSGGFCALRFKESTCSLKSSIVVWSSSHRDSKLSIFVVRVFMCFFPAEFSRTKRWLARSKSWILTSNCS